MAVGMDVRAPSTGDAREPALDRNTIGEYVLAACVSWCQLTEQARHLVKLDELRMERALVSGQRGRHDTVEFRQELDALRTTLETERPAKLKGAEDRSTRRFAYSLPHSAFITLDRLVREHGLDCTAIEKEPPRPLPEGGEGPTPDAQPMLATAAMPRWDTPASEAGSASTAGDVPASTDERTVRRGLAALIPIILVLHEQGQAITGPNIEMKLRERAAAEAARREAP